MNTSLHNSNFEIETRTGDGFGERTRPACDFRRRAENPVTQNILAGKNQMVERGIGRDAQSRTRDACAPVPTFASALKKILVTALLAGIFPTAQAALKVGDALPDLASFQLEGKIPASLKGKIVVVDFWASWCLPCAESFPVMDELQKKYGDRLVVLAVNVDEQAAKMEKFLAKHPVTFTVVRDARQKLVAAVEPETMPTSFILDGEGKVKFLHKGFHGDETRKQYLSEIDSLLK